MGGNADDFVISEFKRNILINHAFLPLQICPGYPIFIYVNIALLGLIDCQERSGESG